MTRQFTGEHLITGIIGQYSLIFTLLISAILVFFSIYLLKTKRDSLKLKIWTIPLFSFCFILVCIALAMLYSAIFNHYFEYSYVYKYSSIELPLQYIFSCLWAGQEGSLLLWLFLIGLVGMINLIIEKNLKAELLLTYSIVIFIFAFLLTGFNFWGYSFGNSPFELLRNNPAYLNLPFFKMSNYAGLIADGNGLNPLLKNPWMVSHPPLLFSGYALCLVPFAYTIAYILKRDLRGYAKKVLPWNILALIFMSTGLLLGGVWAYQDLTFGGFWSWDPVENASLVPWIILVSALHFNLILLKKKPVTIITQIFNFLPFCLVLYAAFLTRSGVLQNASVHSFTGTSTRYIFGILALGFLLFPSILLILNPKLKQKTTISDSDTELPDAKTENKLTKEILLFIGAIVLMLSAFQVIFTTSIPLYNKFFGINLAPPIDPENFYNNWQMIFACLICMLIGVVQYFPVSSHKYKQQLYSLLLAGIASILVTIIFSVYWLDLSVINIVFLFGIVFCILSIIDNKLRQGKTKKNNAAIISHFGLGIFLLGILITFTLKQEIESKAPQAMGNQDGIMAIKGRIIPLTNDKYASYSERIRKGEKIYYRVDLLVKRDGNYYLSNSMYPSLESSEQMNEVFFPDVHHFIKKDVEMFLTYAEITTDSFKNAYSKKLSASDSLLTDQGLFICKGIENDSNNYKVSFSFGQRGGASVDSALIYNTATKTGNEIMVPKTPIKLALSDASADSCLVNVYYKKTDFIIFKIYEYPFIWLIWMGGIIFLIGVVYSAIKRFANQKRN